jgi:hypothetical protein
MQTLKVGSRGSEVRRLQALLGATSDGIFGVKTEKVVKDFQAANGLKVDGEVGRKTWAVLESQIGEGDPSPEVQPGWISRQYKKMGYVLYEDGRVNFGSLRNLPGRPNRFDDWVFCMWKRNGRWKIHLFEATTDPGTYWLRNPSRKAGTAILVPGQYKDVYKIDLHGGKYEALCQRNGSVRVWRDGDKDAEADYQQGEEGVAGWYGINIHRASSTRMSTQVDKWSAGCQVMADPADFAQFMALVHKQADIYGETFTWTLLELETT